MSINEYLNNISMIIELFKKIMGMSSVKRFRIKILRKQQPRK